MKKQYIQPEITLIRLESNLPLCGSGGGTESIQIGVPTNVNDIPGDAESGGFRSNLWD